MNIDQPAMVGVKHGLPIAECDEINIRWNVGLDNINANELSAFFSGSLGVQGDLGVTL